MHCTVCLRTLYDVVYTFVFYSLNCVHTYEYKQYVVEEKKATAVLCVVYILLPYFAAR